MKKKELVCLEPFSGSGTTALELQNNNIDAVLDDRNERAGFKFKDADLIGFPLKIVSGKGAVNGMVEIKERKTGKSIEIMVDGVLEYVKEFMGIITENILMMGEGIWKIKG